MTDIERIDRPAPGGNAAMAWGSDIAAEMLRRLGIEYIALNPGASFRGFHDSLVNYLGNRDPSCCCACMRIMRWQSRMAMPRRRIGQWRSCCTPTSA